MPYSPSSFFSCLYENKNISNEVRRYVSKLMYQDTEIDHKKMHHIYTLTLSNKIDIHFLLFDQLAARYSSFIDLSLSDNNKERISNGKKVYKILLTLY